MESPSFNIVAKLLFGAAFLLFFTAAPRVSEAQVNRDCVRKLSGFLCYACLEHDNGITTAYRILPSGGIGGACQRCSSRCGDGTVERVGSSDCGQTEPVPEQGFAQLIFEDETLREVAEASPEIGVAVLLSAFAADGSNPSGLGLGPTGMARDYTPDAVMRMHREGAARDLGTPRYDGNGWLVESRDIRMAEGRFFEFTRFLTDGATGSREFVPPAVRLHVDAVPEQWSTTRRYAGYRVTSVSFDDLPWFEAP